MIERQESRDGVLDGQLVLVGTAALYDVRHERLVDELHTFRWARRARRVRDHTHLVGRHLRAWVPPTAITNKHFALQIDGNQAYLQTIEQIISF